MTSRILMITIAIASFGCVARPSVRWEQVGKTQEEAQSDHSECRRVALQEEEADLWSKAESKIEEAAAVCMEQKGYRRNTWERLVCCRRLLGS